MTTTTTTTTTDVRADVFIIPNPSVSFNIKRKETYIDFEFWHELKRIWYSLPKKIREGREFESESFVQVWYATPGNPESNWYDHGVDSYPDLKGWRPRYYGYLPKCLFKEYKEGDCITLEMPMVKRILKEDSETGFYTEMYRNQKVQLILAQLKHRYNWKGPFEEVLQKV